MANTLDEILEEFEELTDLDRVGEPLRNARHEIFASHVASGTHPPRAYRIAFQIGEDGEVGNGPHRLLSRPEVRSRVGSLLHARTQTLINRSIVTEMNLMDELAWGIRDARESGKHKEHHSYVKTAATALGMFIETKKKADLADKSLEELRAEAEMLSKELKVPIAPSPSVPSLPSLDEDETRH